MIRRAVFAIAVLTATIYWANCKFEPGMATSSSSGPFFLGCFEGPVTDPAGSGTLIIVLDGSEDQSDKTTLSGCFRFSPGIGSIQEGTFSGAVDSSDSTKAHLKAMANTEFDVLVTRAPGTAEGETS